MTDMYNRLNLDCKRCDGDFGVEIETEGHNLPVADKDEDFDLLWRVEHDGSLNGTPNGIGLEYVFRQPLSLEETKVALGVFKQNCKQAKSVLNPSFRSGVHTHLNIQKYQPLELLTLITTYYVLEDYFVHWSGDGRIGNHFCLRTFDAEGVVQKLVETCERKDWRHLNTENIRYASLNLFSMFKYGSIEFRSMRSTPDIDVIYRWVELIDQLRKGAKKFSSPRDVVEGISQMAGDGEAFVRFVMEDLADEFLQFENVNIWNGIRTVQPLAFLIDWSQFNKGKVNPFA